MNMTMKTRKVHNLDAPSTGGRALVASPDTVTLGQIRDLERRYTSFEKLTEKGFFLGIADYVKYVAETPSLDLIAQKIRQQEAEDLQKVAALEVKLKADIQKTEEELYKLIKKNGVDFPELKEAIREYEGVKTGSTQSSQPFEKALHDGLTGVVRALFAYKPSGLVDVYVEKEPGEDRIFRYKISDHYNQYEQELSRFRELRKTSMWGAWDQVVLVYLVVHKAEEEMAQLEKQNDFWRRMNFAALVGEMKDIIHDHQKYRVEFQIEEYKIHISRVNNFFLEETGAKESYERMIHWGEELMKSVPIVEFPSRLVADLDQIKAIVSQFVEPLSNMKPAIQQAVEKIAEMKPMLLDAAERMQEATKTSSVFNMESLQYHSPQIVDFENYDHTLQRENNNMTREMLEEIKKLRDQNQTFVERSSSVSPAIISSPDRVERKSKLKALKDVCNLGGMEFKLLKILFDFQPHSFATLELKTQTKALPRLKAALAQKIKKEGLVVKSQRGDSFRHPCYQLERLIDTDQVV
jgi:hypothetical protein